MDDSEAAAKAVARWLAPYLAEELGLSNTAEPTTGHYDEATCAVYVSALGDVVLNKAQVFFGLLADQGEIGSLALASAIGVDGPRNIPGVLTTPLKRRAKALGLPYPWEDDTQGDRTHWLDRAGTSRVMIGAIQTEQVRRTARSAA